MPCTYTGSLEGDRALALEESREELGKIITKLTHMSRPYLTIFRNASPLSMAFG